MNCKKCSIEKIIHEIKKCKFECEGGTLESHRGYMALLARIEKLQAELGEYRDAEKFVDDPPHDQECCGCVAILRKQKVQLQTILKKAHLFISKTVIPSGVLKKGTEGNNLLVEIEQALEGGERDG